MIRTARHRAAAKPGRYAAYDAAEEKAKVERRAFHLFDYEKPENPSQEELVKENRLWGNYQAALDDVQKAYQEIGRIADSDPTLLRLIQWVSLR